MTALGVSVFVRLAGVRIRAGIGLFVVVLNGVSFGVHVRVFVQLTGVCVPAGAGLFTVVFDGIGVFV